MKSPFLVVLSGLIAGSCFIPQSAHAQINFAGVARTQSVKRSGKHYKASSSYPQFTTSTPLTRYINARLRSEATVNVSKFAKDALDNKEWGPVGLDWDYDDSVKLYYYAPNRLISLGQMNSVFTGGAHGNYGTSGRNFAILPGSSRARD